MAKKLKTLDIKFGCKPDCRNSEKKRLYLKTVELQLYKIWREDDMHDILNVYVKKIGMELGKHV